MNKKIRSILEKRIQSYLAFYKSTNFEKEVEKWIKDWKNQREDFIRKLESKEMWASPGYVESMDEMCIELPEIYNEHGEQIENEVKKAIETFEEFTFEINCDEFEKRLIKSLKGISLTEPKEEIQALFFEYDSHPEFSIHPYLPDQYELILEEKKHLKYNSGECKNIQRFNDLDFSFIGEDFFGDTPLEDLLIETDLFEYEMDYFFNLKDLITNYVSFLLNTTLERAEVQETLRNFPLKFPFYVYANEHDCQEQSVFYLEK